MTQTQTDRSTDSSLIASDRVEGTKVLDRSGKHIGSINSLKIDRASGRVAYAVAEFGGFLGMGGHEYTIPWRTLNYDPGKHGFSTDLTKEQLEGAPSSSRQPYRASAGGVGTGRRPDAGVTRSAMPDSDFIDNDDNWDRSRERELYDYYVVNYYWDE
jgi:sporulation protein YlmC with PRC-barrel domain